MKRSSMACARDSGSARETDREGRFTLLPSPCLGACDHAPAVMIDGDLHGDVDPEGIEAILERYK